VKNECISWASTRYRENAAKDAALRDMAAHFMVIAFLPFHAAEIRQKIKHWGDTKGFMTQCIVSISPHSESRRIVPLLNRHSVRKIRTLRGRSSTTSISITSVSSGVTTRIRCPHTDLSPPRINAKVGGVNFYPIDKSLELCKSSPMMIVGRYSRFRRLQCHLNPLALGADVGHSSPGVHRPSLAAVVFSVDDTFSRYHALAKLQQGRMEAIADLKQMMVVGRNEP